jgi:hypothetical protein
MQYKTCDICRKDHLVKPKKESATAKPQTLIRWPDDAHGKLEEWARRNGLALSTLLAKYIVDKLDEVTSTHFRLVRDGGDRNPYGDLASAPMVIPDPGFMKRGPGRARLSKDRVTLNPYAALDDAELAMLKKELGGEAAYARFCEESEPLTILRGRQIVDRLKREAAAKRAPKRPRPKRVNTRWDPDRVERLRQRVAEGATTAQLARDFQVSESAIAQVRVREGIRSGRKRRKAPTEAADQAPDQGADIAQEAAE